MGGGAGIESKLNRGRGSNRGNGTTIQHGFESVEHGVVDTIAKSDVQRESIGRKMSGHGVRSTKDLQRSQRKREELDRLSIERKERASPLLAQGGGKLQFGERAKVD